MKRILLFLVCLATFNIQAQNTSYANHYAIYFGNIDKIK